LRSAFCAQPKTLAARLGGGVQQLDHPGVGERIHFEDEACRASGAGMGDFPSYRMFNVPGLGPLWPMLLPPRETVQ